MTSIEDGTFRDCASLATLTLPRGIRFIGDDVFEGCDKLVCQVYEDSYAHQFCKDKKIPFELIDGPVPPKTVKISDCTFDSIDNQTYTGGVVTPSLYITYGDEVLVQGEDYNVAYSNNIAIGKATVTVTGIGDYTGSKSVTFKIVPVGTTISKLTKGSKRFTVKWKKQTKEVTGYQIQYSTSADFSNAKSKKVKKVKTTSLTIKSLKKKTKYYVRIRTYKTVNGKNYYSDWSAVKSVKTR